MVGLHVASQKYKIDSQIVRLYKREKNCTPVAQNR